MKRWLPYGIGIIFLGIVLLSRTAISYPDFMGEWYAYSDGKRYVFSEGIIQESDPNGKNEEMISGAYSVCRDSMLLFARGIEGLETERNVYLIHKSSGDLLCEHPDGTGIVYFTRTPSKGDT